MIKRVIAIVLAVLVVAATATAAFLYFRPLPAPAVALPVETSVSVAPPAPAIPHPQAGSFALRDSQSGVLAGHDDHTIRPIASIAKTMTALAVLQAMPLAAGATGPVHVVTPADVALLQQVIGQDGSHVGVEAGERLTERDLLLGMMLPSANNFAVMLGRWVSGDDATFVARLNAMAVKMGMHDTHFADADGLSADTVSSASDLLVLGAAAVADPALTEVMSHATATMPDGQVIQNIDPMAGTVPGWLGIKTGHTNAGGYCLLFAARETPAAGAAVGGPVPQVTVVGAVLGQPAREDTFTAARSAVDTDLMGYTVVSPDLFVPSATGVVTTAWGASVAATAGPSGSPPLLIHGAAAITETVRPSAISTDVKKGGHIGDVIALLNGTVITYPLVTTGDLAGPPWWWRLRR